MSFTHLHVHTDYSAFDGIALASDYVKKIATDGQTAAAVTDHHNIGGVMALKRECEELGVKPIAGCEFYLAYGNRFDQVSVNIPSASMSGDADEVISGDSKTSKYMHITLLAQSRAGWTNLVTLHNRAYESYYQKPRIDFDLMREYSEGIIALTGCLGGPIAQPLSLAVHRDKNIKSIVTSIASELPDADVEQILGRFMASGSMDVGGALDALGLGDEYKQYIDSPAPKDASAKRRRTFVTSIAKQIELVSAQMATDYRAVAQRNFDELVSIYGRDNVYVEVMYHGIPGEAEVTAALFDFAAENNAPCVATGDAHYVHEREGISHDAWLTAGRKGAKISDPGRYKFSGEGYHVKTEAEMRATSTSQQWQAACDNTALVAARIDADAIPDGSLRLPKFPAPPGFESSTQYFEHLVWEGAKNRLGIPLPAEHEQRLHEEIAIINDMGFADYFLITQDAIRWAASTLSAEAWIARSNGEPAPANDAPKKPILRGPGRGSAAGSLVSYCLDMVHIDAVKHGLYFERFLARDRAGLPDVDSDFEASRRHEVQKYIIARYGYDNFAQIGTYSGMLSKASIKAAGRVLGLREVADALSKVVPMDGAKPVELDRIASVDGGRDFLAAMQKHGDDADRIMEIARGIESRKGSEGRHACGLIISPDNLVDLIPLRKPTAEEVKNNHGLDAWITRWEGPELESFGLLKQDVLGIMNLDIISRTLTLLARRGVTIDVYDIERIVADGGPGADAMWEMLASGDTRGVFQLESQGMTELVTRARPWSLSDLSAIIALYRPGPMGQGMHTQWASIKAGLESKSYAQFTHDAREQAVIATVLDETQGVICYQEQLMRLSQVIAGFDAVRRNKLQKAVSKKIHELLESLHADFVEGGMREFTLPDGSLSPAFSRQTLETLWLTFSASGNYLFNKAHSVAYGAVALWMAYLKANYRPEFTAACLTYVKKDKSGRPKRRGIIQSALAAGVQVLPPSITSSEGSTSVTPDGHVVYGIGEVAGVSDSVSQAIMKARQAGPYTSFHDAVHRIMSTEHQVSFGQVGELIHAGAFDQFGPRRGMATILRTISKGVVPSNPVPIPDWEWGPIERAWRERKALNMVASESPLSRLAPVLAGFRPDGANPPVGVHRAPEFTGQQMVTTGVVASIQVRPGSRGMFASIDLEGSLGDLEVMLWSDDYRRAEADGNVPEVGDVITVKGFVKMREHESESTDEEGKVTTTVVRYVQLAAKQLWIMDDVRPDQSAFPPPPLSIADRFMQIDSALRASIPISRGGTKVSTRAAAKKPASPKASAATKSPRASNPRRGTSRQREVADVGVAEPVVAGVSSLAQPRGPRVPVAEAVAWSAADMEGPGDDFVREDTIMGMDDDDLSVVAPEFSPHEPLPVFSVVPALGEEAPAVSEPVVAHPAPLPGAGSRGGEGEPGDWGLALVVADSDCEGLRRDLFAGILEAHPRRDGRWAPWEGSGVSAPASWCRRAARAAVRLSALPVVPLGAEDDELAPSARKVLAWHVVCAPGGQWVLVHITGVEGEPPVEADVLSQVRAS